MYTRIFAALLVTLTSLSVFAQDDGGGIEIAVKGGAKRILTPLAVPDTKFVGSTKSTAKLVQDVMRRDFELSGFFKVLPNDAFFFDPSTEGMSTSDINFSNWTNVGAQGLIKSEVSASGDAVSLDLRLYQVDAAQPVKLKDWKPSTVKPGDVRSEVHAFVNAVIEYYTGTKGVFGTQIGFVRKVKGGKKQIYVMDMDGSNMRKITKNRAINLLPSFGAGDIYFTSYAHDNPDLWVHRNGKLSKLSSRRGQNSGASYCGGKLAVTLSMGGENADVYLVDANSGKMVKRLTNHWAIDTSPSWNANCSKIAFVSSRSGGPQIYVMNADGSDQKRLTFKGSYNTSPDWSPKGDTIAFTARDERARFDIFTVDLEGRIERLTQDQGNNEDPSYSPDGRYLVFSSTRGGKGKRLWMMTNDGEIQKLATPSGSGYSAPTWSK